MYLGYGFGLDVFQINAIRWRRVERKLTSAAVAAVRKTNKREEKETGRGRGWDGGREGKRRKKNKAISPDEPKGF